MLSYEDAELAEHIYRLVHDYDIPMIDAMLTAGVEAAMIQYLAVTDRGAENN